MLFPTSHWRQYKSSVLVCGQCTKPQLCFDVNARGWEQHKWSPCIIREKTWIDLNHRSRKLLRWPDKLLKIITWLWQMLFLTKYDGQNCAYTLITQSIMNQYIQTYIFLFSQIFHLLSLEPITQLINPSFKPDLYIIQWPAQVHTSEAYFSVFAYKWNACLMLAFLAS